jgi:Transposase DDE domain
VKSSIQRELNDFFGNLWDKEYSIHEVTKSAFTQARKKLKFEAFIELSNNAVKEFYANAPYLMWDKHRVLAVDGSTVMLPNSDEIELEFGSKNFGPKASAKRTVARMSLIYDVLNLVTINGQLSKYDDHETGMLKTQLDAVEFKENDLLLLDRGYPSIGLMYELNSRKLGFCMRLKDNWWTEVNAMLLAGETDKIVTYTLPKKESGLQKKLKQEINTVTVRILVIILDNGQKEILCTNLINAKDYALPDFKQLYHLRWNIEEAYKLFKVRADLDSFSGKSALSVKQDFFACILAMNLCAVLDFPIEQKVREQTTNPEYKRVQKVNKTNSLAMVVKSMIGIFIKRKLKQFITAFDQILQKSTEIVRPGRSFTRNHKQKKPKSMNYKKL